MKEINAADTLVNITLSDVRIDEALAHMEKELYKYAIEVARYNQCQAAKLLGVSRGTLRNKLNHYYPGVYIYAEGSTKK